MIDLDKLTKLMANDTNRVEMFLDIYRREIPMQLEQIKVAIVKKDYENVSLVAHSVKSQSAYLNADVAVDIAHQIELQSQHSKVDHIEIFKMYKTLEIEVEKILQLIERQ